MKNKFIIIKNEDEKSSKVIVPVRIRSINLKEYMCDKIHDLLKRRMIAT